MNKRTFFFRVVSEECYPYDSGRTQVPGECQIPKAQYRRAEGLTCPAPSSNNKIFKMTPPYRVSDKVRLYSKYPPTLLISPTLSGGGYHDGDYDERSGAGHLRRP